MFRNVVVLAVLCALCIPAAVISQGSPDDLCRRATHFLETRKPDEAIRLYNQVLDRKIDHRGALLGLGKAYLAKKHLPRARRALEFFTATYPRSTEGLWFLAELQLQLDQVSSAKRSFLKILRIKPDHVPALVGLGKLEVLQGHRFTGEQYLKKALALDPANADLKRTVEDVIATNRRYLRAKKAEKRAMIRELFEKAMAYKATHETQLGLQAGDWIICYREVAHQADARGGKTTCKECRQPVLLRRGQTGRSLCLGWRFKHVNNRAVAYEWMSRNCDCPGTR